MPSLPDLISTVPFEVHSFFFTKIYHYCAFGCSWISRCRIEPKAILYYGCKFNGHESWGHYFTIYHNHLLIVHSVWMVKPTFHFKVLNVWPLPSWIVLFRMYPLYEATTDVRPIPLLSPMQKSGRGIQRKTHTVRLHCSQFTFLISFAWIKPVNWIIFRKNTPIPAYFIATIMFMAVKLKAYFESNNQKPTFKNHKKEKKCH